MRGPGSKNGLALDTTNICQGMDVVVEQVIIEEEWATVEVELPMVACCEQ